MTNLSFKEKCDFMLDLLFPNQPRLRDKWWTSSNKAFEGMTPCEAFEIEPQNVTTYLYRQFSGDYM